MKSLIAFIITLWLCFANVVNANDEFSDAVKSVTLSKLTYLVKVP